MNLVSGGCIANDSTNYELEGLIERINDTQIKVTLNTFINNSIQSTSVTTRSHIFENEWLATNLYQVSLSASNSTIINS